MKWTLLMRFAGPMQSWGTRSRFGYRDTEVAPSKSGVIGVVSAALGRKRGDSISDLATLRLGVRIDRPGTLMSDYHTALNAIRADGSANKDAVLSRRMYLADAKFLVGLEGEDKGVLADIYVALKNPKWPLALGRRSFPPGDLIPFIPPVDENPLVSEGLEEALVAYKPLADIESSEQVRYLIEHEEGDQVWLDQPRDDFSNRTFSPRNVRVVSAKWGEPWFSVD